jgi:hypothetical protein
MNKLQIIDRKNKDYYDHFSKIYGEVKSVTFDRSCSFKFSNKTDYLIFVTEAKSNRCSSRNNILLLETGYFQYLLFYSPIQWEQRLEGPVNFSGGLQRVVKYDEHQNYFHHPITLSHDFKFNYHNQGLWQKFNPEKIKNLQQNLTVKAGKRTIFNPILSGTDIPSFIDPFEIWNNISNYISSLNNDKKVDINLTDAQKAINHGWEPVKNAFRPNIKK